LPKKCVCTKVNKLGYRKNVKAVRLRKSRTVQKFYGFWKILADNSIKVTKCHTDLEPVDLDST